MKIVYVLAIAILMVACSNEPTQKTKDIVLTVDLINDPIKIAEYEKYHSAIWPEVKEGFKKAGFTNIVIYRFHNHLTMIITIPEEADLSEMSKVSAENNPKMREWDMLMARYQKGVEGSKPGQTWVVMDEVFRLSN